MTSIFFQLQALILHEECYKTRRVLQDKNATSSCDVLNVKHCNSIMLLCFQNLPFTNSILVPFLTQWIWHTYNGTPEACHFWHTFNLTCMSCIIFWTTECLTHLYLLCSGKIQWKHVVPYRIPILCWLVFSIIVKLNSCVIAHQKLTGLKIHRN